MGLGIGHIRRSPLLSLLLAGLALICSGRAASQEKPSTQNARDAAETHLSKGYEALRQDRYDAAVSEFRAALQLDPKQVLRARFPLAVALFESHKSDEARREFEAVRREAADHPNVLYYLGRLDLEDQKFESAIEDFRKAVVNPPFPDTPYYLGYAYFKQGNLPEAEKWLKQAVQVNPQDARMQYQLGLVYRKEGLEQEASKTLALSEELRQRDANESRLRLECGQKLDQGPREEARAICEQLYDPDNAEKLAALGTIYAQHGDLESALKPLRRAAELAPESPQMQYNLALAYYQMNQFDKARGPLADALKRWPDLFQLNALYGAVLTKLGEEVPAYEALRHANKLNPQDSGTEDSLFLATLVVARKSRDARQYVDALRYFAEAAKLKPQEPAPHRGMAEIYNLTGRPAQAKSEQQEADRLMKSLGGVL